MGEKRAIKTITVKLHNPSRRKRKILDKVMHIVLPSAFNYLVDFYREKNEELDLIKIVAAWKKFLEKFYKEYKGESRKGLFSKALNSFMEEEKPLINPARWMNKNKLSEFFRKILPNDGLNSGVKDGICIKTAETIMSNISWKIKREDTGYPEKKQFIEKTSEEIEEEWVQILEQISIQESAGKAHELDQKLKKKVRPPYYPIEFGRVRDFDIVKKNDKYFAWLPIAPARSEKRVLMEDGVSLHGKKNKFSTQTIILPIEFEENKEDHQYLKYVISKEWKHCSGAVIKRNKSELLEDAYICLKCKPNKRKIFYNFKNLPACQIYCPVCKKKMIKKVKDDYYLQVVISKEPPLAFEPQKYLGVVFGRLSIYYTLISKTFEHLYSKNISRIGSIIKDDKDNEKRIKNQKKGRHIKYRKQRKRKKNETHIYANEILRIAKEEKALIILQDLSGIRKRMMDFRVSKKKIAYFRFLINCWNFREFQRIVEYKAIERGLPKPFSYKYWSPICPLCHRKIKDMDEDQRDRFYEKRKEKLFSCPVCLYEAESDEAMSYQAAYQGGKSYEKYNK